MKKIFFIMGILSVLVSCSDVIYYKPMNPSVIEANVQEGRTHKNKILEMFGEPNEIIRTSEGKEVYKYQRIVNGKIENLKLYSTIME